MRKLIKLELCEGEFDELDGRRVGTLGGHLAQGHKSKEDVSNGSIVASIARVLQLHSVHRNILILILQ